MRCIQVLEVKRKDNESFENMVRRFTKKTIQSGKILQAKKVRFYSKDSSKRKQKESALRRLDMSGKVEYLKRIGKLDDFLTKRYGK
ncbi:MAG: 30S ribosomal protein S21 [Parcubacteria group bacterium GW2011_GWA2_36_10]|nr:MAG: 30S ribosomal protein S21 [Parcubacteria group bacterium GW2011_GWA2_36_10]